MTSNSASRPTHITANDLDAYWAGAQLFGSSIGGHDLTWLLAWTRALLEDNGPVELVAAADLTDAHCAAVLVMGRMTSLLELMPYGGEVTSAVDALTRRTGRPLDAVFPLDAANINAIVPLAAAAQLGIPIVDCDGMGRIFPLIHQTSLYLAGLPLGPIAASSPQGDTVVVDSDGPQADALMRSMLDQLGGWALTVMNPCNSADLARAALPGTVSRLLTVGRIVLESASSSVLTQRLIKEVGARVIGSGPVAHVEHNSKRTGIAHPSLPSSVVVVEKSPPGRVIHLEIQNEVLLALVDGRVAASIPDTLCLLDTHTGDIVGTDQIRVGDSVEIVVLPSAPVWHTQAGLALAGPEAFGIKLERGGRG